MLRRKIALLQCFLLLACVCRGETTAPGTLLVIEPNTTYTRNSEGDILPLKDGSLALVYSRFSGGDDDASSAELSLRTSKDGGQSWSADSVIVANEGGRNVMSVSLERLPSGEILLFYLRKDSPHTLCNIFVRRSRDELKTVSDAVRVSSVDGYHVMNNARVLMTSKGRIIAPAVLHSGYSNDAAPDPSRFSARGVPFVYYSDDQGRSWKRDTTSLERPTTGPILQENGLVELADGRIMMYIRSDQGCQMACYSRDQGVTWTKPERTALASPLSPATIRRVPDTGELLCVWNDHSGLHPFEKGKRTPLCISTSADEGKTWRPSQVIEGNRDGWYCYTSILFNEGRTILSYCAGDKKVGGLNRLKIVELPKELIESGK